MRSPFSRPAERGRVGATAVPRVDVLSLLVPAARLPLFLPLRPAHRRPLHVLPFFSPSHPDPLFYNPQLLPPTPERAVPPPVARPRSSS